MLILMVKIRLLSSRLLGRPVSTMKRCIGVIDPSGSGSNFYREALDPCPQVPIFSVYVPICAPSSGVSGCQAQISSLMQEVSSLICGIP